MDKRWLDYVAYENALNVLLREFNHQWNCNSLLQVKAFIEEKKAIQKQIEEYERLMSELWLEAIHTV